MATTPTWDLPLPADGQTPWGDDYRSAMLTIDERLGGLRGSLYVEDNAAETVISAVNTPTPVLFAPSKVQSGPFCRFCEIDTDAGTITYIGPLTRVPTVQLAFTLQSGGNNLTYTVSVRRNGQPIPGARTRVRFGNITPLSGAIVANTELATGDVLQVWVANLTDDRNATMLDMTFAARG